MIKQINEKLEGRWFKNLKKGYLEIKINLLTTIIRKFGSWKGIFIRRKIIG